MLNVFYRDSHLQGRMSGPLKVIGNLFKGKNKTDELKELLIFIAPKVID